MDRRDLAERAARGAAANAVDEIEPARMRLRRRPGAPAPIQRRIFSGSVKRYGDANRLRQIAQFDALHII